MQCTCFSRGGQPASACAVPSLPTPRHTRSCSLARARQDYGTRKQLEHLWKAAVHGGAAVSVTDPRHYAARLLSSVQHIFVEGSE